jgi:hypothetical protein
MCVDSYARQTLFLLLSMRVCPLLKVHACPMSSHAQLMSGLLSEARGSKWYKPALAAYVRSHELRDKDDWQPAHCVANLLRKFEYNVSIYWLVGSE